MRHTLQKIAMIMAVCFTALFTGCQKDDSPGTEQFTNSNTTITKISFEEFKNHPKAFGEFEKLEGSKEGFKPKSREYGDGYYYETEEVTLIEYNDERYSYKSYIFPMYRETPTNSIENLLIWEKSTGETNSYILTYYLSESDIESILTGNPIYLGDKTQIVPVQKSVPDPYVVQSAEGICGVYSGLEPDYGDYFTMNVEGTTVYFDVVDCGQYVIDFSLMQGSNNGGSNGGGSSTGGDDGWSVGVVYFPLIPGSGDGGGPVTDPDGPGGYYTYNPVEHTPVINVMYQQFYSGSLDSNQRMFLLANKDIRDRITQLVTVLSGYTEGPYALAEIIIDFAMEGYEEEALQILDYLNQGGLNLNSNEVRELIEEIINLVSSEPNDSQAVNEILNFLNQDDWRKRIKQAIASGVSTTAELMHGIYTDLSQIAQEYPSSINTVNKIVSILRSTALPLIDTNPNTCSWPDLLNMWLFEVGPEEFQIVGNTSTVSDLKVQEGVNQARALALSKIGNNDFSQTNKSWAYGQQQFYDGMINGNITTAFVGSYTTNVTVSSTPNGYQLNFHISNTTGWESGTRFRIDNDGDGIHDGIIPNRDRGTENSINLGGNFFQEWYWTEPVN